ncbi:MAG: hypothetical protein ACR2QC_09730 [Gammaproteobacteria bacterium]
MGKKSKSRKNRKSQASGNRRSKPSGLASPRLQFPPGEKSGLTALALSVSADKNSPAIVREILQNSLDAAKAANRECAHVRFSVESVAVAGIPGIGEYNRALEKVEEFCAQTNWPAQSRDIFQGLKSNAAEESLPVLFVADNGMGLDNDNMEAILSDGLNKKMNPGAGGSHGNGHFTTFNLSDMRYLLYGGVSERDGMLASGHAILASHQDAEGVYGKDGYYVAGIRPDLLRHYDFPVGDDIPPIILDKLQMIESEWNTGALIAVLDFNHFGKKTDEEAGDLILGAAARNFFVAVQRGELVVEVVFGGKCQSLTADNLPKVMEDIAPDIGRTPKFPSHEKAERFYRLFTDGKKGGYGAHETKVETAAGVFDVIYRESNHASTRIALCRNGMWITDDIPMISGSRFAEHAPFEALVLCDDVGVCELVCLAEGNLHNALHIGMVKDRQKAQKLRDALKKIRESLQEKISKQSDESFDFLEIEGPGSIGVSLGRDAPKKERVGPAGGTGGGLGNRGRGRKGGKNRKGGSGKSAKPGSHINVRFVAVRERNAMKIRIMPKESLKSSQEAELRLVRNGGGDFSCDNPAADDVAIPLTKVVCNGSECAVDGDKISVRIGEVNENEPKIISVEFESPKVRGHYRVDCEFIRRERRP